MASLDLILTSTFRPAYHALLDCGHAIAATHGEDAAVEWAQRVLSADFDLFVKTEVERPRPVLRLVRGGAD